MHKTNTTGRKARTCAIALLIAALGTGCAGFSQSVGPDGVHQKAGPYEQHVGPDGVHQQAGPWHQDVDSEGVRQEHRRNRAPRHSPEKQA